MTGFAPISSRLAAALADRYGIQRELGAGGMATVYLAEDLKHHRMVAIKVLKPELAAVMGAERFLSEIRTTANLHHPHILPLFDSGEADGFLFYVMPFVEGESLRQRMSREKELPVREAVTVAVKVAGALQAAHDRGIIHRDVKPENILFQGAEPLVADFGIALAVSAAGGSRMTETGLSLGTPSYMSPEQATGDRAPDVRSDVYGLGCILYEMLAGRPPHVGGTAQQVLAKILTADPEPVTAQRSQIPANVAAAVRTALQRVPADRFPTARDFADALQDESFRGLAGAAPAPGEGGRTSYALLGVAAAVALAAGLGIGVGLGRDGADPLPRIRQLTNTGGVGCASISPDGERVALVEGAIDDGGRCAGRLVVRPLPAGAPALLADSVAEAGSMSWASDGSALLLTASVRRGPRGIHVAPLTGGPLRRIADEPDAGAWMAAFKTPDSVVVAAGREMRVLDARNGEVLRTGTLEREIFAGSWSEPLGRWAGMYYAPGRLRAAGVLALMDGDFEPLDSIHGYPLAPVQWVGRNGVLFVEAGPHEISTETLMEVRVEGDRFTDPPRPLREGVNVPGGGVSSDGRVGVVILQSTVDAVAGADLESGAVTKPARSVGSYLTRPAISPDGERIAFHRNDLLGPNPYLVPFGGGEEIPLGSRSGRLHDRLDWTADGSGIVMSGHPEVPAALYDVATGTERTLDVRGIFIGGLPDGRLVFLTGDEDEPGDTLFSVDPATRDRHPVGVLEHPILAGRLSPWHNRVWMVVVDPSGAEPRTISLDLDAGEWSEHGAFPRPLSRILAVDPEGFLYWEDPDEGTRIWRWRPGAGPELQRELPFECIAGYASMTPDARRFVCNAAGSDADAWLLEWGGSP